jgi:hypothetical protein
MAAKTGTILNLLMNGTRRPCALLPAFSSHFKTHDFGISKPRYRPSSYSGAPSNRAQVRFIQSRKCSRFESEAAFQRNQACAVFHKRRSRGFKTAAFKASRYVEAETLPWVARWLKKASISVFPIFSRLVLPPWNLTYRSIQSQ